MQRINNVRINVSTTFLFVIVGCGAFASAVAAEQEAREVDFKTQFLRFCDIACKELNKPITPFVDRKDADAKTHHMPFFEDSYAIRALAVAYDMTGEGKYLDACKAWSDHVIDLQSKMIPAGAYFMNYKYQQRQPGQNKGDWYVADSGCIAMGVLATAVRCTDAADKDRYLNSVKSFAKLVMDKYVDSSGGISNGIWGGIRVPWWCSSATFGSTALLLYEETGDEWYLKVGRGAFEWLIRRGFRTVEVEQQSFKEIPGAVVFYTFELYSIGVKHLDRDTETWKAAQAQIDDGLRWMTENQKGRGANTDWQYKSAGKTYMAGMPYIMYSLANQLPEYRDLQSAADRETLYLIDLLTENGDPRVNELETWELFYWTMTSLAERVSPGALHRKSR